MKTLLLAVLPALLVLAPAGRADTITLLNGTTLDAVTIKGETFERIVFKKTGSRATQNVKSADVKSVSYSRTSKEYREAQKLLQEGKLGAAASLLVSAVATDDRVSTFVRASALVEAAEALVVNGNIAEALEAFDQLLTQYPDTRHLARALLGKGRAALYGGQFGQAQSAFEQLMHDADTKGFGQRWSMEAEFNLWRARQAQGKLPSSKVRAGYEDLRQRAQSLFPGIAHGCALQLGRLMLSEHRAQSAVGLFDEVIDGRLEAERETAAGGFNGRAQCFFALAEGLRQKGTLDNAGQLYAKARLDFLRVVVSYPDVKSAQPEALYMAGQCFLNIADAHADKHAASLFKRCRDRYRGSAWAEKAAQQ